MGRFFSVLLAFVMSLAIIALGLGIVSQFVDSTDTCTVKSTAEIHIRERSKAYRINTEECGTFTVSAVPLRGISTEDARHMFERINLGEQYEITHIREGFGVFSLNSAMIDFEPSN